MEPQTQTAERSCLACGKTMDSRKRKDSKFCNEYCKAAYHNPQRAGVHADVKRINKILLKNCEILEKMLGKHETVYVALQKLAKKGFNFNFITQVNGEYKYCYYLCYCDKGAKGYLIGKAYTSVLHRD